MFIGHYAIAFGARRMLPRVSLGALFLACQLADLVWPVLVLMDIERVEVHPGDTVVTPLAFVHYPYTHSLLAMAGWAVGFVLLYRVFNPVGPRASLALGGVVLSHWLLDFVSHRPDLPLAPGTSARFGLSLWNSLPATMIVEGLLFAVGLGAYLASTRARDRTGSLALWGLVAFLLLAWAANLFGPPPPNARIVAWSALALWPLVAWAYWIDRHRRGRLA